jgi:aspartyl-tRNA(Asn)/glutamyl-tRNA(Gln) amidotransferase subunit C
MTLTLDDVRRIAHSKLEAIFALINELQAVDTAGIEPMSHAQDVMLPLRDDAVTETDRHALYQSAAPAVEDGLYLVPRVVE